MSALKTWEYTDDYFKNNIKIQLFNDRVEMLDSLYKIPRILSFNNVFESSIPLGKLQVDFELLKELINTLDIDQVSEAAKPVYNFYKTFDCQKIEEKTIFIESQNMNNKCYYYTLNKYGIANFLIKNGVKFYNKNQRFSSFFFNGPQEPNLALKLRIEWRLFVWKALGAHANISFNQAFVLFDYSKIEALSYEKYSDPGRNETYGFNINQGLVTITEWCGIGGGDHYYSIEDLWYSDTSIYPKFQEHKAIIRKTLEAAIIESNSELLKDEEPKQAPPV
jgi:hypothetical protein